MSVKGAAVASKHHRPFTLVRVFLRLWIIATIPLAALWWFDGINPVNRLINDVAREAYTALYRGTFYLLHEELAAVPAAQRPAHIEVLASHFGYHLSLQRAGDGSFSEEERTALAAGEIVFRGGEPPSLAQQLPDSSLVLHMLLGETEAEKNERSARGTIHLVRQRLGRYPPQQWPELIAAYQPHFGFAVEVLGIDSDRLGLAADERVKLRRSGVYTRRGGELAEVAYLLLDDGRQVIRAETRAGGVTAPLLLLIAFSTLCAALGVGIYLWLWPLWRDLKHMDTVAAQFGEGYFDARTALKNRSVVAGLGQSFNRMAESIQQLVDGQKELVNAVSHDLRTPMSRLRFALEMLETESDPQDRARYLHNIQRSVASLENLVNELLVHARFDRSPSRLNFDKHDLHHFVKEEIALFTGGGATIEVVAPNAAWGLDCVFDREALARALGNLLDNARRYARRRIVLHLDIAEGWCTIAVDDDGPGVAAAERDHIFKPFTRLDDHAPGSGHGLGLAIVRQIAKWHGGRVSVTESPLGGARFLLQWPAE